MNNPKDQPETPELDEAIADALALGSGGGWFNNGKTLVAIKQLILDREEMAQQRGYAVAEEVFENSKREAKLEVLEKVREYWGEYSPDHTYHGDGNFVVIPVADIDQTIKEVKGE